MVFLSTICFSQKMMMKTSEGDITVKLYPKKAPITVANFLKYVNEKRYDNTSFAEPFVWIISRKEIFQFR